MTIHLTKKQIRQEYLAQRQALSTEFIAQASDRISQYIQELDDYRYAQHIAWYFPVRGEVDLTSLWQIALNTGKSCYFPVIQANQTLHFLPFTAQTPLLPNQYGILEPKISPKQVKRPQELDLIFLPLVAFDSTCTRLGMGKGYYDKTLQHCDHLYRIGVAYDWQQYPTLPADPWDMPLHKVVTEKKIYAILPPHDNQTHRDP